MKKCIKKSIAYMVILILVLSTLSGCGKKENGSSEQIGQNPQQGTESAIDNDLIAKDTQANDTQKPADSQIQEDTQLSENLYKASDCNQFSECNKQLKEAIESDVELAKLFDEEQLEQINDDYTPDGYTWHHNEEIGKMQLVDSEIHVKTGHTGGRSIWGGGSENR